MVQKYLPFKNRIFEDLPRFVPVFISSNSCLGVESLEVRHKRTHHGRFALNLNSCCFSVFRGGSRAFR